MLVRFYGRVVPSEFMFKPGFGVHCTIPKLLTSVN